MRNVRNRMKFSKTPRRIAEDAETGDEMERNGKLAKERSSPVRLASIKRNG